MAPLGDPPPNSDGIVDRVASFVSENKKALLISAGIVAVAAGGAYYYTTRGLSLGKDDGARRKDKKKKNKKRKDGGLNEGPILEEMKSSVESVDLDDEPLLSAEEIEAMSMEDRAAKAATLKAKGNEAYQKRRYKVASEYYTRAIAVTPRPEPVFYSNRAACYLNMDPARYENVIEDCNEALKLDANYLKAMNRRASAYESLKNWKESLRDFTASTILDKFQNPTSAQAVERVLKKYATEEAVEILKTREIRLPCPSFLAAYFAAFRPRPLPVLPAKPTTADEQLLKAYEAFEAADYMHSFTLVNECLVGEGPSTAEGKADAVNLRGTYLFLCGDSSKALEDFTRATELMPTHTQSWVKLASVYMEQGDAQKTFAAFDTAIENNKNDPDIYYHRGQVNFIMGEWAKSMEDYTRSTELDDKFVFSHIQLAVAQYKSGDIGKSMATFRKTLRVFPDRSEPLNYYGELLLDQTRFQEALEKFERAIELEKKKTKGVNVLPMVNKGLAMFQSKQDIAGAIDLCNQALAIDEENEAAIATLAQLNLQHGNLREAVKLFDKHCQVARTEPELVNALTYKHASEAQMEFIDNYPHMASQMGQIAQSMMA